RREIVAELVHQLRGVGVQIEDADLVVQRAGLVGREAHEPPARCGRQRSAHASSTASAASTRLNGGITYAPATRCLTPASASCAIWIPSARAAGPEPTFAIRARYSAGIDIPGTSLWRNSALRCD